MIGKKYTYGIIVFAVMSISCQGDYENQVEKSKKLSNSFRNEKLPSYDSLYNQIIQNNSVLTADKLIADSLYRSTKEISNIIDSLVIVIEKADPTGEITEIGQSILVTSPVGLRLTKGAHEIYQNSLQLMKDEGKKKHLKERFSKYRYLGTIKFNEIYFSISSSSFIVMTLLALKIDIIESTFLTLLELDKSATIKRIRRY